MQINLTQSGVNFPSDCLKENYIGNSSTSHDHKPCFLNTEIPSTSGYLHFKSRRIYIWLNITHRHTNTHTHTHTYIYIWM